MKPLTANDLTKLALEYLNARGHFVWRSNNIRVPGRTFIGKKGVSDIQGITKGGVGLFVEVKIPPDIKSKEQESFEREITMRHAIYIVIENFRQLELSGL